MASCFPYLASEHKTVVGHGEHSAAPHGSWHSFADETADVLEVSTQMNISERRREDSTPKVDADFFNRQVDH